MSSGRLLVVFATAALSALAIDSEAARALASARGRAPAPAAADAQAARADSPARAVSPSAAAPRAPAAPALTVPPGGAQRDEQAETGSPAGETDPLVANGLGSPACGSRTGEIELAASEQRNCRTSGFVGSAAPTGSYGIDVHIDTGLLGLSSGGLLSAVQDLVVTPVWMALVWIIHALLVMLEWSFSIDLLDGAGAASIHAELLSAQSGLTAPWLPLVLALASLLIAYRGLVLRRVADSLGEALAMALMIAGGLWLILDPAGTVGMVSRWADQAAAGTLSVATQGSPVAPQRAFGASMAGLFSAALQAPWCYLEFGDVRWCSDPSRLDPSLRAAGLKIAQRELGEARCGGITGACSGAGGNVARSLQTSARLLREARSNGALFLALPANGAARNSINDDWSLLRTLCQSDEATNCHGQTAAQAQFRTNGGTWSRVGGLLLIAIGLLGLILLLGHLALRLLMAAVLSVLYLLLAPGVVLAPTLGERGRELFRAWAGRLFGAVVSKLVYAFLLGVVLTLIALLSALQGLGWWAQWLLMSAFWWSAFLRRHQLHAATAGAIPRGASRPPRPLARSLENAYDISQRTRERARRRRERARGKPGPDTAEQQPGSGHDRLRLSGVRGGRSAPAVHAGSMPPHRRGSGAPEEERAVQLRAAEQLARIDDALARARADGDRRRLVALELRRARVAQRIGETADERPGAQRDAPAVRLEIDRELAARHAIAAPARGDRAAGDAAKAVSPAPDDGSIEAVWEDIRAYSDGRKRQLGIGKP
ncbi:MAG TPA: type IV secretion system protein [Solirubrobacteraceae bacterium]